MSAIYGMYHWGTHSFESVLQKMEEPLHQYKIDRFRTGQMGPVEFGCGLQIFTQEAEREILPVVDEEQQIMMTADIVLDNRSELMHQLGIKTPGIADGELAYRAYSKWGEEFVKLLRGVFSIAIFDWKRERLFLYTDHTGSRAVHYYCAEQGFVFATAFGSILNLCPEITVSEKWITACEAMRTEKLELFSQLTPYEQVLQLEAGTYLVVGEHTFEKKVYWDPLKKREQLPSDDGMCKPLFLSTFRSCVKDVLRSCHNTAATVSSGLDSTSVAAVAAEFLGKEGKKLHSFTSVPEEAFEEAEQYAVTNEAWGPKALALQYPNIEVNLIPCEGMDGFTKLESLVSQLEFPMKSAPNMMWLDEIYRLAREKGCRILLKGEYGNATISYGTILGNLRVQVSKGHVLRAIREADAYSRENGVPKGKIWKQYLRERKKEKKKSEPEAASYVKTSLLEQYQIEQNVRQWKKKAGGGIMDTEEQQRNFLFQPVQLAQMALYDTYFSLIYGVLLRDPTKDKRMIELCLSLPIECYVHNGIERRLVREYLQGVVPDVILRQVRRRGVQSADYAERVVKNWKQNKERVCQALRKPCLAAYLEESKLQSLWEELEHLEERDLEEQQRLVSDAFQIYALACFLDKKEDL